MRKISKKGFEWDFSPLVKKDFKKERKEIEKAYFDFRDKWKNNSDYLKNPEVLKKALDEYNNLMENYFWGGSEGYYYNLKQKQEETHRISLI